MSKCIRGIGAVILCASVFCATPVLAQTKGETGFGTLKKLDPKGQRMMITAYNWENHEIEDTTYIYNVRKIELFNVEDVKELKKGDDVEFEWIPQGNRKFILKLAKGTMPMEEVELLWDPAVIPEDVEAAPIPVVEGDTPATDPAATTEPTPPDAADTEPVVTEQSPEVTGTAEAETAPETPTE